MLKKILSFLIFIIFCAGLAFALFKYPEFFKRQVNKVQGVYYIYQGDRQYRKWNLQRAIRYYQNGLRLYPSHYTAWTNLGNIYIAYEDYYSATDAYEEAIKYNPKYVVARMNYGIVSTEKLGDFDGAIEQYNAILDTKRRLLSIPFIYNNRRSTKANKGLAYYNRGVAYKQKSLYTSDTDWELKRQYLKDALESYISASKILKKDYDTRYNLALAQHLLGDYHDAGLNYCRAIELAPMNYDAHYNLAILLKHLRYYKESLNELEKATNLITNSEGATNRQRYIFDVMNDVTKIVLAQSENSLVENLDGTPAQADGSELTMVGGKLVKAEDLDKAMLKNFRTCQARKIFKEDITEDYDSLDLDSHAPVRLP
ncbi:tetratricopeptide repeat protein [bacterium]|nr:tetratricopeptide repeat protein [bacterium]